MMDGLILVQKPIGITSHDVVKRIRKILNRKKVGHFGTLDPLATGLLLIAVGKATRLFPFFLNRKKTYVGRIRLGYSTDTYDSDGKRLSRESKEYPDKRSLLENMKKFEGEIEQLPPPYSAKKYKGNTLYNLARRKKEFELRSAKVVVHHFTLKKYFPPYLDFETQCSSGTYIRSIAHDLGQNLGCGAHLHQLVRTEIGEFHVDKSQTVDEIEEMFAEGQIDNFLHPVEILLPEFPKIVVNDKTMLLVRTGSEFGPDPMPSGSHLKLARGSRKEEKQQVFRIFDTRGCLIAYATGKTEDNLFHPFLVFDPKNSS